MLGSTLLSAATALFFLPAVFSAPVAPATSVSVPEVETTTISTTKSVAIQKVTEVFVEKKSQLDALYDQFVKVDASKVDTKLVSELCEHVVGILHDTVTGVQAASTTAVDSVAVEVNIATLVEAICGLLATVFCLLGHIIGVVGLVLDEICPIIATVLVAVIGVLKVVATLVPTILVLVGRVLMKVDGLVTIVKALVALNIREISFIVAFVQLGM